MEISIRPVPNASDDAHAVRVELDMYSDGKLMSEPMSADEAERLRAELHRRIFEIGEGIKSGRYDRM